MRFEDPVFRQKKREKKRKKKIRRAKKKNEEKNRKKKNLSKGRDGRLPPFNEMNSNGQRALRPSLTDGSIRRPFEPAYLPNGDNRFCLDRLQKRWVTAGYAQVGCAPPPCDCQWPAGAPHDLATTEQDQPPPGHCPMAAILFTPFGTT